MYLFRSVLFFVVISFVQCESFTPIVLWHGMGDTCCNPLSLGSIIKDLKASLPGVYVLSLEIGENVIQDFESGYFKHPNDQIVYACEKIKNDTNLAGGFNAIGFSQGAQFLRGLVQRCDVQVKSLISVGGQHQGVYGLPNCENISHSLCDYMRQLLNHAAYVPWVQDFLVQATYWHDPLHEDKYKSGSTFIAEINNEQEINQDYIDRLQQLDAFVMVKFNQDTMVEPIESSWFGFYEPGNVKSVQSLQETNLYSEDRLGLRSLDDQNKLHMLSVDGNHLKFKWEWFEENIVDPFLRN